MSLARREILQATLIGLLIAAALFAIFALATSVMGRQVTVDTEEFEAVVEWGEEINFEGVVITDNRTLGTAKTPLTKDMIVSIEDAEEAGKKKVVFEHMDEEYVIYVDIKYRVDFVSYGEIIDSQLVFKPNELNLPEPTVKFGQEFCGWDIDLSKDFTESIKVHAKYKNIEVPELESVTATYGDTLGSIKLPENKHGKWEFVDSPDTYVGDAGSHEFRVKYTYANRRDWVKYDSIIVDVEKKHLEFKDVNESFVYDGEEHFPTYTVDENVNVFVVGSPNTETGEYEYSFEIIEANYEGSYSGTYKILKPDVTITVSSATMYYGEEIPEFTYTIVGFENAELLGISINAPTFISNTGEIYVGVTYTNNNVNCIVQEGTLTVLKANQDVPEPEIGTVTFGDKLGDIPFEGRYLGTWAWEDPEQIVDDINGISAWAVFTHDNENYNQVRKLIEIKEVNKRVLEIRIDQSEFTYSPGVEYSLIYTIVGDESYQALKVVGNDPEINADRYVRTLKIDDPCYAGEVTVDLVINKAIPETNFVTEIDAVWNENLYLYDISLPAGCKWENSTAKIDKVGNYTYTAIYTHEDENYYAVEVEFDLTVKKADVILIGVKDSYSATYVKDTVFDMTSGISVLFSEGALSFEYYLDGEQVDAIMSAGVYTVLIKVDEDTNYFGTTVERTVTIAKAENKESVITSQKATYGDSIDTLTLPEGIEGYWEWANAGDTVGNAGEHKYIAKYVSTTGNYFEREVEVTVKVDKDEVTVPTIDDRYFINDIIKSDLTNTDLYEVVVSTDIGGTSVGTYSVTLKLKDADNFKWENTDGTSDLYEITYKIVTASITNLTMTLDKTLWKYEDSYAVITTSKTESFGEIVLVYSTSKNGTYSETKPTDAGTYYVKAIVRAEDDSETPDWSYAETEPVSFTIEKDTANITGIKNENDYKYTYNFADIDITGGIDIDHNELDADDLVFEYWLGTTKVDLIKDPGTYTVKIIASETTNYNAVTEEFTVVVNKIANEDLVDDTILHQSAVYGDDISNIKLPEHTAGIGAWTVITTGETVGNAGTNTFTVKFTPSQANSKYYAEREITVTVEVDRKDVLRPTLSFTSGIYNGSPYIPVLTHRDNSALYSYTDFSDILTVGAQNVGTYTITFSLGDNASNYRWENGDSEFDLTLVITSDEDYTIDVTVDEWIYNDSNENDSKIHVTVPAGVAGEKIIEYFVKNEDGEYVAVVPKNAGTYYVKVTVAGDNSGNGNWSEESTDYIEFTIGKDTVDFGTIELDAIYNQTLADIAAKLPSVPEGTLTWNAPDTVVGNAGYTYTFYATYTSSTENYHNNNSVQVKVTVGKAASVISGFADKIVDFIGGDYRAEIENAVTVTGTGTLDFTVKLNGEIVDEIKNQGTYTVYVTYTGDNNYEAITELEPITVVVNAITVAPTVFIDGWTYTIGNTNAKAPVPGNIPTFVEGSYISYYYTGMTNAGVAYADSAVPAEAGSYTVTITVKASEFGNWALATDSYDFIIDRADASITVEKNHSTSYTGSAYDILSTVVVNSGVGTPYFIINTFNGSTTDLTDITLAGDYVLTVYLAETPNYYEAKVEEVVVDVERATTSITGLLGFIKDYADTDYLGLVLNGVDISVIQGVVDPDPENNKIVWTINGVLIDENTRIINQGTYEIVATYLGDDNYKESTDSCTVTVNALTTSVDSISGIDSKEYDMGSLEATVELTNGYTSPTVKYYIKNGDTYTWLGVDENGNPILPTNAGTYRIGITAPGDDVNGNWSSLDIYSDDFIISWCVVPYPEMSNKPYTGEHVPSGYEDEWRYDVEEGTANINVGIYDVIFTLNNYDGIINFVWGDEDRNPILDKDGNPTVAPYETSYRVLSADDNVWVSAPAITPVPGADKIIFSEGMVITADTKFGGYDITFYKYNPETKKYDIEVGKSVYLRDDSGELYLSIDATPEYADKYLAVFSFNDPNHMTGEDKSVTFEIERKTVLRPTLDIIGGIYKGGVYTPVLTHRDDSTLYSYTDFSNILTVGAQNVGTYTITFDLGANASNYKWENGDKVIDLTLVITPNEDYTIDVTVDPWIYNDLNVNNSKIDVEVPAGVVGKQTIEYFVKDGDEYVPAIPKNQGTYYVKVTVAGDSSVYGNWTEQSTDYIEFTIVPDDLDFGTIELDAIFEDTLADITAKLPTTLGGVSIEGTLVWNVTNTTAVGNAGDHTFTVKYVPDSNGNYNAIDEITVEVSVDRLGIPVLDLIKDSFEFDNMEVTLEDLFGTDVFVGFRVEIEENINARDDEYTVTLILDGNHKWIIGENTYSTDNQEHKFSITKATFADDITVEIAKDEWIYGDAAAKLNRTGIPAFIASDLISYRYVGVDVDYDSDVMPDKVGTYNVYVVVKATDGGNWDEQQSIDFEEFTITKKQLTVIYTNTNLVYGGPDAVKDYDHYDTVYGNLSLEGILVGDDVSVLKDSAFSMIGAGDYNVSIVLTGDDAANYSLNITHVEENIATKTTTVGITSEQYTVDGVTFNGKYFNNIAIGIDVTKPDHGFGTLNVTYYKKDASGEYQPMGKGEVPVNFGSYKAVVTVSGDTNATPNWEGAEAFVEFNIEKAILSPIFEIDSWEYHPDNINAVDPKLTGLPSFVTDSYLSDYIYKGKSNSGFVYDGTVVPALAGNNYFVYLTIAADTVNGNWDETEVSVSFSITRAPVSITFTPSELDYNGGDRYEDIQKMFSASNGSDPSNFALTIKDANGNVVTAMNHGTYYVSATLPITSNYQAASYPANGVDGTVEIKPFDTTDVTISSESYTITAEDGSTVTVIGKVYNKGAIVITVNGRNHSFGTQTVTYYYKDANGEYQPMLNNAVPVNFGSYKAVVSITGSTDGNWPAAEEYVEFVINPAPSSIEVGETVANNDNKVEVDFKGSEYKLETLIGAGAIGYFDGDEAEIIYTITEFTKHGAASSVDTPPTVIKDAGVYKVLVTLKSNSNYVDAEPVEITVTVKKVDYQFGSYSISATYGQTLADIASKLPKFDHGTLAWSLDSTTAVGNAGSTYTFTAVYTNTDGNYNDEDIDISITVGMADTVISGFEESYTLYYNGSNLLADIISGAVVKRGNVTLTDADITWSITEIVSIETYTVTATYAGDSNHNGAEVTATIVVNPAFVEIKDFVFDNTNIVYTQTATPSASFIINGDEDLSFDGIGITFLYSNDNASTWKTFDEIKNTSGYLNNGTYLVKAVVLQDDTKCWDYAETSATTLTVSKLAPNNVVISFTGDSDSATNLYYQNSVVVDCTGSYVEYVDTVNNISIRIPGTLEFNNDVKFKGENSIYTFSFTPTGHFEGNVVVDNTTKKATVSGTIGLKIVALIGSSYPTTYTYPADSTSANAYGTIEDAVNKSASGSTIWVVPDTSGKVVIKNDLEIKGNKTLLLPYLANNTVGRNASGQSTVQTVGTLYGNNNDQKVTSKILLADGKTITVNSGSTLEISGILSGGAGGNTYAGHTGGEHARLVLGAGSKIVCEGVIKAYGYIHESYEGNGSSITVKNGATLYQPLVLRDFKGGSLMYACYSGMSDYGYSPFNQPMFVNVHPTTTYEYGGTCKVWANLATTKVIGSGIQHNHTEGTLIGTTSDAFIQLTDPDYSSFVAKYSKTTDIMDIDIYGGAKTNALSLTVNVIVDVTMSSTQFVYGFSWMNHITLNKAEGQKAASYTMDQRYKLLPGCELTVGEGVTLNAATLTVYDAYDEATGTGFKDVIKTQPYPYVYPASSSTYSGTVIPGAKLTVKGTLIAANLGGKVYADGEGAEVMVTGSTTVTTYEPSANEGSSMSAKVTERQTITNTLQLYYEHYVDGVLTETNQFADSIATNKMYTSVATLKNWKEKVTVKIDLDGFDVTVNDTRYNHTEYDSVEVEEGATVIFHLASNQILSVNGATSFTYSEYTALTFGGDHEMANATTAQLSTAKVLTVVKVTVSDGSSYVSSIAYPGSTNANGERVAIITATTGDKTIYKDGGSLSMTVTGGSVSFTDQNNRGSASGNTYSVAGTNGSGTAENITATITLESSGSILITVSHTAGTKESSGCVTPDTMITLADGTQKEIQYVTYDDLLLVWDFVNGEYTVVPAALIVNHGFGDQTIIELTFDDGTVVKAITAHSFFDVDTNKWELLDAINAYEYIGHSFVKANEESYTTVRLLDVKVYQEYTESYSLVSAYHYNFIVENMFSLTNSVHNMLAGLVVGENMTYDQVVLESDVAEYGLYSYDVFEDYVTYEQYLAFNGPYLKISVEKGYLTFNDILDLISTYLS